MLPQKQIKVLIVDDHDMLREGLSIFIQAHADLELVGEAASGIEAIRQCELLKPDVVLMDLIMPEMDGVTAIQTIHKQIPEIKIIALTSFGEDELVKSALRAGASGYLLKNVSADKLAEAIRSTRAGFLTLAPEIAGNLVSSSNTSPLAEKPYNLTQREAEILTLMAKGASNVAISNQLNISKYTVKNHVSNILEKLEVNSRTEAVSLSLQKNIVHLD
jgi:two-component system, NarL family, response regulator LiaR